MGRGRSVGGHRMLGSVHSAPGPPGTTWGGIPGAAFPREGRPDSLASLFTPPLHKTLTVPGQPILSLAVGELLSERRPALCWLPVLCATVTHIEPSACWGADNPHPYSQKRKAGEGRDLPGSHSFCVVRLCSQSCLSFVSQSNVHIEKYTEMRIQLDGFAQHEHVASAAPRSRDSVTRTPKAPWPLPCSAFPRAASALTPHPSRGGLASSCSSPTGLAQRQLCLASFSCCR